MIRVAKLVGFPSDVVRDLESSGHATRLPLVRDRSLITPDVLIIGAQVATSLITFAQIPQTIDYLSGAIVRWRHRTPNETVSLELSGPQGRVALDLTPGTTAEDIAAVLRLVGQPATLGTDAPRGAHPQASDSQSA